MSQGDKLGTCELWQHEQPHKRDGQMCARWRPLDEGERRLMANWQDERAEFEKWARDAHLPTDMVPEQYFMPDGSYQYAASKIAWDCWQAAVQATRERIAKGMEAEAIARKHRPVDCELLAGCVRRGEIG